MRLALNVAANATSAEAYCEEFDELAIAPFFEEEYASTIGTSVDRVDACVRRVDISLMNRGDAAATT